MKRDKCEECGDYRFLNDDDICNDCAQDLVDMEDLEEWLPEDEESEEN